MKLFGNRIRRILGRNKIESLEEVKVYLEERLSQEEDERKFWTGRYIRDEASVDLHSALELILKYQNVLNRVFAPDPQVKEANLLLKKYGYKSQSNLEGAFQVKGLPKHIKEKEEKYPDTGSLHAELYEEDGKLKLREKENKDK